MKFQDLHTAEARIQLMEKLSETFLSRAGKNDEEGLFPLKI